MAYPNEPNLGWVIWFIWWVGSCVVTCIVSLYLLARKKGA
jgi:hypothetical protein